MMKIIPLLLVTVVILLAPNAEASDPVIDGDVYGWELCEQSVCGSAAFLGVFAGRIDGRYQFGVVAVSVVHEPLPDPGRFSDLLGGQWALYTRRHRIEGVVTDGAICNNGNETFTVTAALDIDEGGEGALHAAVLLDHNVFPPTIEGRMMQVWPPAPPACS